MADLSAQLVRGKQAAFQYKPIVSEDLSWLARTENQRNYLESQAKQKEQQDLRDQLIKIQQLGLPKEMQGYLNSQVDDLIRKVRAGEIDPQSYDFRSAIAGIGGEANQLNNINENLKTLAAEDKQIIGEDESGNPVDLSDKMRQAYMTGFDTDYTKGTDVFGKYAGIQTAFAKAVDPIKFDDQAASTLADAWIKRNANKYKSISELQQQGYSGYDLITEVAKIDPQAIEDYRSGLESQGSVSLISEYAKAKKVAEATGVPIEDFETYKQKRLSLYMPKTEQVLKQDIETDPFTLASYKEGLKGKGSLAGIFSQPVEYKLPEYPDSSPTETIATTLNLSKESTLDYQDPNTGEMLRGQPTKINRLFYDPQTQQYILGFNRYKKAEGQTLPEGVTIVDFGGDKGKFYLDKSEELYQRANENDLNFDALVSTIMAETKSTRPQVIARLQAIKEAASATQSEIPQKMRSGDIEVDTSGTVLVNNQQITFEEVLKNLNDDKDRAVRFWSLRVPADKVRRLNESEAAGVSSENSNFVGVPKDGF